MNSFAVVIFVSCLAAANASRLHGPSAVVPQGPSGKTSLVRHKGSHISAISARGQVVHEGHPAHAAPVHGLISTHDAPHISHATPVLAHHAAPSTAHSSAHGHDNVLVAGPSGTISTTQHQTTCYSCPKPAVVFKASQSGIPMQTFGEPDRIKIPSFSANLGIRQSSSSSD